MQHPRESEQLAPFVVHHEVEIGALLDVVWDLQIHVNEWPSWQPAIESATLDGVMAVGAHFSFTGWDTTITATVNTVALRHRLVWRAYTAGVAGVHEWTFAPSPVGTLVCVTELMEPTWPGDVAVHGQCDDHEFLYLWLEHLRAEAEARS